MEENSLRTTAFCYLCSKKMYSTYSRIFKWLNLRNAEVRRGESLLGYAEHHVLHSTILQSVDLVCRYLYVIFYSVTRQRKLDNMWNTVKPFIVLFVALRGWSKPFSEDLDLPVSWTSTCEQTEWQIDLERGCVTFMSKISVVVLPGIKKQQQINKQNRWTGVLYGLSWI